MSLMTSQLTDTQAKILGALAHRPGTLIWMGLLMIILGSIGVFQSSSKRTESGCTILT